MKNLSQKIIKYVMKSKKRKVYCVLGLVYFLAVVFVMNDAWLYQTPIAKLTKVETRMTGEKHSWNEGEKIRAEYSRSCSKREK